MKKGEEYEEGGTEGSKGEQRGVKGEPVGGTGTQRRKRKLERHTAVMSGSHAGLYDGGTRPCRARKEGNGKLNNTLPS